MIDPQRGRVPFTNASQAEAFVNQLSSTINQYPTFEEFIRDLKDESTR